MAETREAMASASSCVRFPFSTCLAREVARPASMASAESRPRLRRITVYPPAATTSAMPDPMMPDPMIPTRAMDMRGELTGQ